MIEQTEQEALASALLKVKAQKENFGFVERFTVDENYVVQIVLEKQIPIKPIKDPKAFYRMGEEYHDWICPRCNSFLAYEFDASRKARVKICKCGQKLKWEGDK